MMAAVGVILAGGASRRMGRNKAFVEIDGMPMIARVSSALRDGGVGSLLVVGGDPAASLVVGATFVEDRNQGEGPVAGLMAAAGYLQHGQMLVVACDLGFLGETTVRELLQGLDHYDVAVAYGYRREPLCALWRIAAVLDHVRSCFDGGVRSVRDVLDGLAVVDVVASCPEELTNFNHPADLDRSQD